MTILNDIKNALSKNNITIGSKQTIKSLKIKNLKSVVIANNCPENIKKDINHYAKLSGINVEGFDGTGKQLGIFCGKPFSIATLGIGEEKKK